MLPRILTLGLLALGLFLVPATARAIELERPCDTPSVFPGAAVNVVVLPYSLPASLSGSQTRTGERLGALVQLETVLAIAKFGSIGVVQLTQSGDSGRACAPEIVADKLLGKQQGAAQTLRPGGALILIWGRIFESGSDLFLQSYIRFLRSGVDETIDVPVGNRTLKGAMSTQAFACAPRKIAIRDLADIERQFGSARLLYSQPQATSPVVKIPVGQGPFSYWITDVRGDWVQLQPMQSAPAGNATLPRGWLQARSADAQWSLRRHMPELYFIEGVAGYLAARTQAGNAAVVESSLQAAETSIGRYLDAWGANAVLGADAAAGGTPLAVAVPRQLRGFVGLLRARASDASLVEARTQFERAATLAPHSSNAHNLTTVIRVAQAYRQRLADETPQRLIDRLRALLGTDPDNKTILANLGALYDLVLTPGTTLPPAWNVSESDKARLIRERDAMKALLPKAS